MSNSDSTTKSTRVVEFGGEQKEYHTWRQKFKACAQINGYAQFLDGTTTIPSKSSFETAQAVDEDQRTLDQKMIIKHYTSAMRGYYDLTLSQKNDTNNGIVALSLIEKAVDIEHPDGNCKLAWEALQNKFEAQLSPRYVELNKILHSMKLEDDYKDPDLFITKMESIRTQMNQIQIVGKTPISDVDLILLIINNVPEAYSNQVQYINHMLDDDPTNLTIEQVRTELRTQYLRLRKQRRVKQMARERAMLALQQQKAAEAYKSMLGDAAKSLASFSSDEIAAFVKTFKGTCNKCGAYGHKGANCPNKANRSGDGSAGDDEEGKP